MATGDDAVAEGMSVVLGTEDRRNGATEITKTRDYVAQFFRAAKAYTDTKFNAISLTWGAITGKPATFPPSGHVHDVSQVTSGGNLLSSRIWYHTSATTLRAQDDSAQLWLQGGQVYTNNTFLLPSATAADSNYTICYINGDGRVSKGASSQRYKDHITPVDPAALGDIWPMLHTFQMIGGDGSTKVGYIAEHLAADDDTRPFVVYAEVDGERVPDSIDFIALLLAQNAQLHQAVDLLAQRLNALEGRS